MVHAILTHAFTSVQFVNILSAPTIVAVLVLVFTVAHQLMRKDW